MIRLATLEDAEQLFSLNEKFNGKDETELDKLKDSLSNNEQEVIVVAEEDNILVGFVCVQLKKSFCYSDYLPEITEVFVDENYRRRKIASKMIAFAETYCRENYPLHKFELLTGKKNAKAQALYASLGYCDEGEIHLTKRFS
ncbi:MAG: GNAT family N-acetyltransferase [Lachnospiraceae bacterium]|nr:GNAT family N-acetyltransferase [Lachnospiraceae bacterium]